MQVTADHQRNSSDLATDLEKRVKFQNMASIASNHVSKVEIKQTKPRQVIAVDNDDMGDEGEDREEDEKDRISDFDLGADPNEMDFRDGGDIWDDDGQTR